MTHTLRIMAWNANGLLQHRDELQAILSAENIDICLISETYFTSESHIKLKNYITYHTIHPANTARGGSGVIIRKNIRHYEEENFMTRDMQATTLTLLTTKQMLTISTIYYPLWCNIHAVQYLEYFRKLNGGLIIEGDFNAKHTFWGSRLITPKGRELYQAVMTYACEFVSTCKPTY